MLKKEKRIINFIQKKTQCENLDNISRTKAYLNYYKRNPEVWWALLASMVSRNAGWNMTDLKSNWYQNMMTRNYSYTLFLTFERANWLIFSDAFPQLLLYEISKKQNMPLFDLLNHFHVSAFMIKEWNRFWQEKDLERLCTALIINEQHYIQKPVIEHPYYSKHVFRTMPYFFVEHLHFNTVLFPTNEGQLYGFSVQQFQCVDHRIELGKKLAWLLFYSEVRAKIHSFALNIEPTGSRKEYEPFLSWQIQKQTPTLRSVYSPVIHHEYLKQDWIQYTSNIERFFQKWREPNREFILTKWYENKMIELYLVMKIEMKLKHVLKKLNAVNEIV